MNNIGIKQGMLYVADKKREGHKYYYLCKCDCGSEKWIRTDSFKAGQKSCGCAAKTTQFKSNDLTGKTF